MSHKRRDHGYPPVPEPLETPVYDNHTHIDPELHDEVLDAGAQVDAAGAADAAAAPAPGAESAKAALADAAATGGDSSAPDASAPDASSPDASTPDASANADRTDRPAAVDNAPADWIEQLDRAQAVGVIGIVQAGTNLATSRWAAEHADLDRRMLGGVAIHPNEVPAYVDAGVLDEALDELDRLAARDRVRVVGETGLDFHYTAPDRHGDQIASFERHIEIAKAHGLALQIHDRDAHREVVETLLRVGAPERTVFHCFSGDAELASICAEHGWYASFSGTVTFKNAEGVRAGLRVLPRELVLVETDAPYLTPTPYRGRPNAPYLLPLTVRFIADVLGLSADALAAQTVANTVRVYGEW